MRRPRASATGHADSTPPVGTSGRWFSHQPNVPGRGILASYSTRFWTLVVGLGLATGILASALMALLKLVEHLSYGYRSGPFLDGVRAAAPWRHVVALLLAALLVGAGASLVQRLPVSHGTEVSDALWLRGARLAFLPSVTRSVLSIVTVGMGVSLGREAAPQLAGAATASWLSDWAQLPTWQRRLLVASGAGAGFAAVYNVPLGGALFALEVLLGTVALPLVLPALAVSVIATAVAWITLGADHTYQMPDYALRPAQMVWAVLAGPLIGLAAVVWVRVIARANALRPRGWGRYLAPLVVFGLLAVISIPYRQLLGNGKGIVQLAVLGQVSLGLFVVLLALSPWPRRSVWHRGGSRRTVHADADDRRVAGGSARGRVVTHLARNRAGQLRVDRRRGVLGRRDAGATVRGRTGGRAHAPLRHSGGPHPGDRDRGNRRGPPARRAVDLFRPAWSRAGCGHRPRGGNVGSDRRPGTPPPGGPETDRPGSP